jgi:hypothetical protein
MVRGDEGRGAAAALPGAAAAAAVEVKREKGREETRVRRYGAKGRGMKIASDARDAVVSVLTFVGLSRREIRRFCRDAE